MSVHRTLAGGWAECLTPEACELLFHVPDLSVGEAEVLPLHMLLPLFDVIDPPTLVEEYKDVPQKVWHDENGEPHRDYDLPAIVSEDDGTYYWCQRGAVHRDGDLPALITPTHREWYQGGSRHRGGGKPAVIYVSGDLPDEYWREGRQYSSDGAPLQWAVA